MNTNRKIIFKKSVQPYKRNRRGTNQYRVKHKSQWKTYLYCYYIFVLFCVGNGIYNHIVPHEKLRLINPLGVARVEAQAVTVNTPTEHELIIEEIKNVFGNDSSKAFKLLSCENARLNPHAKLDDVPLGGIGEDIGVFQINTVWQGVSNKTFLYDWKINIAIAHNIYIRNNNSFKLWTCGKKLGI